MEVGWMTLVSIVALAVGLAMDAAAASAARGIAARRVTWGNVLLLAGMFGGFQMVMPLLGWFLGRTLGPWVESWDHWIAFCLLGGIGAKMIYEASRPKEEVAEDHAPFRFRLVLVLAVATSIDSFAAGIALPLVEAPLFLSIGIIGGITALLSAGGLIVGRKFGSLLGSRLDAFGGVLLLVLGSKILLEHLIAG